MVHIDTGAPLDKQQIKKIQTACGNFLYLKRAQSTAPSETTANAVKQLLNYCATNPEPKVLYTVSDMILCIDSDTTYLVEPQERSKLGGYHFLGSSDGKNQWRGPRPCKNN